MISIMSRRGIHLSEDLLEEYVFGRLKGSALSTVEEHLLICADCRRRLEETEGFIRAARIAARRLQEDPLDLIHDTSDGPVRLWVRRTPEGDWEALFSGEQLGGARRFATIAEANEYLLEAFREMFPEHQCTEACGARQTFCAGGIQ